MTSRIWRIDLRYDPVLDEGGAQNGRSARNATDRCGKCQLIATMTVWMIGDKSIYSQTIETIGNMEPSNTFYANHLFCPGWLMKTTG